MRNQVKAPGDTSKPFIGIKIIPKMKVLDYDPITKNYVREMTYTVSKFEYTGIHKITNKYNNKYQCC